MNEQNEVWPGWQILEELDGGQFGQVYKVKRPDDADGSTVSALKVITLPQSNTAHHYIDYQFQNSTINIRGTMFETIAEQIKQIGKVAAYLTHNSDNPSIVKHLEYKIQHSEDGHSWRILIRCEYLPSLAQIAPDKQMSENDVIELGIAICRALELCHQNNIVHRNIKPQNIFADNGTFKLGDIGTTTVSGSNTAVSISQTESFLAPEIYYQVKHDHTVDIYSLGLIMYRLMNGMKMPLVKAASGVPTEAEKKEAQYLRYHSDNPLPAPAHASQMLSAVILKACSYKAEDRYATAAEMRAALESIRVTASFIPDPKPVKKKSIVPVLIVIGVIAAAAAAAATLFFTGAFDFASGSNPVDTEQYYAEEDTFTAPETEPPTETDTVAVTEAVTTMPVEPETEPIETEQVEEQPTVTEASIVSISIASKAKTMEYTVGDTLDTSGLAIKVTYDDGTTEVIDTGFTCYPSSLTTAGSQQINVSYQGKKTNYRVTVTEKKEPVTAVVKSLSIVSMPKVTQYYVGERLNTEGLMLKVTYDNGKSKNVTAGFTCSPVNLTAVGSQSINVTYGDKTIAFTVTVKAAVSVSGISVAQMPNKTTYKVGERFDTTGLTLLVKYSDGTSKRITQGFTCGSPDMSRAATINVGVSYQGKETSFKITVQKSTQQSTTVSVKSISVAANPTVTQYNVGDKLNTSGLSLKVTYSDNSTKTVKSGFTCNPTTLTSAGTQKITVTYSGKTTTFTVTVKASVSLTGLSVAKLPTKTVYDTNARVDTAGLVLNAKYSDGTTGQINQGFTCSSPNTAKPGTYNVEVSYQGLKTTFQITVLNITSSGKCGDNVNWYYGDGVLVINGKGLMHDFLSNSGQPWYAFNTDIKQVIIESGVTSIGTTAFAYCKNLSSVSIANTVGSIGKHAFLGCQSLTTVTLPSSVLVIKGQAFTDCTSLTTINIPDSVTVINDRAFSGCDSLRSITIPASVTTLGSEEFYSCDNLREIILLGRSSVPSKWSSTWNASCDAEIIFKP